MVVDFDASRNRASDSASGMAVEHVRDDHPMECGEFYRLTWEGRSYDFRVSWDDGFAKIEKANPNLSIKDQSRLTHEMNRKKFFVTKIPGLETKNLISKVDVFLELFSTVCRNRHKTINIIIEFAFWDAEGKKTPRRFLFSH